MRVSSSFVRRGVAVAALACLGVVSGCGVSAQTLRPGVAAEVDGSTVSIKDVDHDIPDYCRGRTQLFQSPAVSGAVGRQEVLEGLVYRKVADLVNDESGFHFTPSSTYELFATEAEQRLTSLTSSQRDVALPVLLGQYYFADIVNQIGIKELQAAHAQITAPAQEDEFPQLPYGLKVVEAFVAKHPVTTDPEFSSIDVTTLTDQRSDLSVAQSSIASSALGAAQPTPTGAATAYADSLPVTQQCG